MIVFTHASNQITPCIFVEIF